MWYIMDVIVQDSHPRGGGMRGKAETCTKLLLAVP